MKKTGLLRRFAPRNDVKRASAISRRDAARAVQERFALGKQRAWGMPGARCTRSLACSVKNTRVSHHGRTGTPGIPARNGFNGLFRALPGDRAFLSPSFADMACLRPVGPTYLRELDAGVEASGPHDFAVRSNISRQHAIDRYQAPARPAITSRAQRCRVHRIPPRVRDDRETPLCGTGWQRI